MSVPSSVKERRWVGFRTDLGGGRTVGPVGGATRSAPQQPGHAM